MHHRDRTWRDGLTLDALAARLDGVGRLVAIDMETTGNPTPGAADVARMPKGLRPPGVVIEIGCVELLRDGGWTKGRTWETRVRPDAPINPRSIPVHGIRPGDLTKAPRFAEIAEDLLAFLGDAPLVAHAAENEMAFLNYEFRRMRLLGWDQTMFHEDRFICTKELSHDAFPGQSGSLDALVDRLWIDRSDRFAKHGALLDADLTADAFVKLAVGDLDERTLSLP